jgi:hypothetical protein
MVISHASSLPGKLDEGVTHKPRQLGDRVHGGHRTVLVTDELGILTKTPNGGL